MGVGSTQRRRYESCREAGFGTSGARRCQHETGWNALREGALVCGSVRTTRHVPSKPKACNVTHTLEFQSAASGSCQLSGGLPRL